MKKCSLSRKKSSTFSDAKKSQSKISSFFPRISKPDVSNNEVISDIKSQTSTEKRKKRDDVIEEDLYTSSKRKCMDNSVRVAKSANVKLHENSVLLSVNKDIENIENNCKENKIFCEDAQRDDKEGISIISTKKMEYNKNALQNSTSVNDTNVPEDNSHVLKELQDVYTTVSKSFLSSARMRTYDESNLHNLKIESFEDLSAVDTDEFNDDFFDQNWHTDAQINFVTLQKCKIIDVKCEPRVTILRVQQIDGEAIDTVVCSGFWKDARVRIGDVVTIQAKMDLQRWIVDNNNGFLITHSDTLLSTTTITSGLFCNRRAVLNEKFRKIDSLPGSEGDATLMTVGSLVHQWLQRTLQEDVSMLSDISKLLECILQSRDTIDYLYASQLSLDDCRSRMSNYSLNIFQFVQHYIKGKKQERITERGREVFQDSFCGVQDIEENVCIPQLGMKGRVDVTVEVKIHSKRKTMPLEVKTGKSSQSFEHRGQVILYLMMMALRDQEIDTGLLLYLKDNKMLEIHSSHHERRDLILLRNTLAHYFIKRSEDFRNISSESDLKDLTELPQPINHPACSRCSYQTLCCAYLARDSDTKLEPSHSLAVYVKQLLENLESSHLDYVMKWIALLALEESSDIDNSSLSDLWTMNSEKREARGTCICNLKIAGKGVKQDDRYQHIFARINIKEKIVENSELGGGTFVEDDYIVVSTDTRINITSGYVGHVSNDTITVLLDKDIAQDNTTYHIDKYPFSGSLFASNYANVAGLLNQNEIGKRLRSIVIDKKTATFAEKVPRTVVSTSAKIICDLNEDQQRAVLRAVATEDYVLIKGMPGTGKTQTVAALIELLLELGSTVLITAHTNSAVDNVLLKLLDRNIDFLRLGATKQVHPLLTSKTEKYATRCYDSLESLETFYNRINVVGVTCYSAYHPLLYRRTFDICVVDESAQIMQPTVLRPLYSARRFVLVGDPDQLPPVIRNRTAAKLGADESLFVRLDSETNTVNLTKQYRMNARIMKIANDTTYHGKLISGNKRVENATLIGSNIEALSSCEEWVRRALSRRLVDSVIVLDTGSTHNLKVIESHDESFMSSDQKYSNVWEAAIVSRLVQVLTEMGVHARNIGIIAPYNAHVSLLKKIMQNEDMEVNTVDRYQGRDKDVILYSCARSTEWDTKKELQILDDQRRLTVAITRAKHKLIVIADKTTLEKYRPFKNLFDVIDEENVIHLRDGEEDFNWKSLIRSVL